MSEKKTHTFDIHPSAKVTVKTEKIHQPLIEMDDAWGVNFDFRKAAEDLMESFNGHDCVHFLEEVHRAAARRIVEHWQRYSPEQLKKEEYKQYLKYAE